ncbi:MAG: hypothetical protein K2Y22_12015 [Candidatus Obscuribacterales bacterium]|nr:hypothetical protein [Candidatus Obscuribacterales bacterium]
MDINLTDYLHYETVAEVSLKNLILGGMFAMLFSCLLVGLLLPFMLVLIVPVALFLMIFLACSLAFGEISSRKAQSIANRHLSAPGKTKLQVIEQVGEKSALVLNDWGVVFCSVGKRPVEFSWDEIAQVDEPQAKVLIVRDRNNANFKLDLAVAKRFFLVTASMFSKIPARCNFDINPLTGESRLIEKLKTEPREWKGSWGHFKVSDEGVEFNDRKIQWDVLQEVDETIADADPDPGMLGKIYSMRFKAPGTSFVVTSNHLENGYDLLKRVTAEKRPQSTSFAGDASSPRDIAYDEFCLLQELLSVQTPLNKRKAAYLERYYSYMFQLINRFKFKFYPQVRRFLEDYAKVLRFMGREAEAKQLDEFVPD